MQTGLKFLGNSDMTRHDLARAIFIAMAEGTNPTRDVPAALLEKSAKLAYRAADVFLRVWQSEAESESAK